ncbi:hypothetical protein [Cyanobacterium aponinum]|uniref:CopG family transcriptional regulator n=1 Tax=Cyanobacterium aponinum (strain PCC 10605) TaxID=755178 RepID=K9Z3G4_CYAAP|nr:hypothetical protein [Cyanobacterium aponinum]AFZ53272.1 hypothetical protein Cyan10605_1150 [Cyanobacterium aponinum PCC 10605]
MNNKIRYTDEDLEFGEIVEDFLPPPEKLTLKGIKIQIPVELTEKNLSFLKQEANRNNISYQNLIELIINEYIEQHGQNFT